MIRVFHSPLACCCRKQVALLGRDSISFLTNKLARDVGIEPTLRRLECLVLPLYETPINWFKLLQSLFPAVPTFMEPNTDGYSFR